jgi:hypothetical protein
VLEALKAWPRLFEADGEAIVPLTVLPNVVRERVLEDLLEQLRTLMPRSGLRRLEQVPCHS